MAKAPAARQLGDDYQARLFWYHACELFLPHYDVEAVGFETDEPLGFDDVVVKYRRSQPDGKGGYIQRDYFQSKFHVAQTGSFFHTSLIEPAFIGNTKASVLSRLKEAQSAAQQQGLRCRYTLVSPWSIHPDDPLAKLRDFGSDFLRLEALAEGKTEASEMGAVRASWRGHLGLKDDSELFELLSVFRLNSGSFSFDELRRVLNDRLFYAGFRPASDQHVSFLYDDLIRKAYYQGMQEFDKDLLRALAEQDDLWVGPPQAAEDRPRVIAVRSFIKWTQQIADSADEFLDLAPYFSGRQILDDSHWTSEIWPRLAGFLERSVDQGDARYDLHLDAHTTIAFAAGRALAKAPASITPIQRTGPISSIRWTPISDDKALDVKADWHVSDESLSSGDPSVLALAVSITHDTKDDVVSFLSNSGSLVGRVLHASPEGGPGRSAIRNGAHAWTLAEALAHRMRQERGRRSPGTPLHVFIAAPNAFTFFLGQHAHLLGPCQLYEYAFESGELGAYKPSLLVTSKPAGVTQERQEEQSA